MNSFNDYIDVIYLDKDEIIDSNNFVYGNFYKKVTTKKIFNKWSNRYFFIKHKIMYIWKKRKNKIYKKEKIIIDRHSYLSGLKHIANGNSSTYFTFKYTYFDVSIKKKTLHFKSYNPKIIHLYKFIENILFTNR